MDKKVLLVADDEAMNRMIITRFLSGDYTVLEAADGAEVMRLLGETKVDALLLDIIMPEMDGLEVLKALQENPAYADIGVLVATSTKEKTERTALTLGADDIVSKPYDPVVIKKRLENILAAKAQYRLLAAAAEDGGVDAALAARLDEVLTAAAAPLGQIRRCAKLIGANKENFALVGEMTAEIAKQADSVEATLNRKKADENGG